MGYVPGMVHVWAWARRAVWQGAGVIALALACASCAPLPEPVPLEAACTVTDGDTIRCGDEKIRLVGIDAPERPGSCRPGRQCVVGDYAAASATLAQAMTKGPFRIIRMGSGGYGRTLGSVFAGEVNLSCAQLERGVAIYRRDWDNRRAIARTCPALAGP